jgi:hypothetical protein
VILAINSSVQFRSIARQLDDALEGTSARPCNTERPSERFVLLTMHSVPALMTLHNTESGDQHSFTNHALCPALMTPLATLSHNTKGLFFPTGVFNYETFAVGLRVPFDYFASDVVNIIQDGWVNPTCTVLVFSAAFECASTRIGWH